MLFDSFPFVRAGWGDQTNPVPKAFQSRWSLERPRWKQVHGTQIAKVTTLGQECGEVDALYTEAPGIFLAAAAADCVPILFAHRGGKGVAAAHAGWRGTFDQIAKVVMRELSTIAPASEWSAVIGPCIRACCYEVSPELIENFSRQFPDLAKLEMNPTDRKLDLQQINAHQLGRAGIGAIECIPTCTFCSANPEYYSFRKTGTRERQLNVIELIPD